MDLAQDGLRILTLPAPVAMVADFADLFALTGIMEGETGPGVVAELVQAALWIVCQFNVVVVRIHFAQEVAVLMEVLALSGVVVQFYGVVFGDIAQACAQVALVDMGLAGGIVAEQKAPPVAEDKQTVFARTLDFQAVFVFKAPVSAEQALVRVARAVVQRQFQRQVTRQADQCFIPGQLAGLQYHQACLACAQYAFQVGCIGQGAIGLFD